MNKIETYFRLLLVSHLTRITTGAVFLILGACFGTGGILEISSMNVFWDIFMWFGIAILAIYTIYLTFRGIYNVFWGYQPGDYNKWRDGGTFEEWEAKQKELNKNKKKWWDLRK
jgi:hypothetical protein